MRSGANDRSVAEEPVRPRVPPKTFLSQLLGGSLTLLAGSGLVGVANLVYNVATARLLGPTGFAHATAVYTLLMLMSAITLSFQVVCAKYVASATSAEDKASAFAQLHQRAWMAGIAIGLLLLLARHALVQYLNLPDPALISLLALGTAFYIPLGARRGYIQGIHAFGALAVNFILEGLVRLGGVFLFVALGLGVQGAVLASVLAVIITYFAARPSPSAALSGSWRISIPFLEGVQAIVFFSGQAVINNFDIVLVKHFFPPGEAGLYAAVALVGRLITMCAWSVVNAMFPVSAGASSDDDERSPVLFTSLSLVFIILTVLIGALWMVPSLLWTTLFGSHFGIGAQGGFASLLILYAVATGIYSLSSVIITYEISRRIGHTSWIQLAFSGALAIGICVFHDSLRQVIVVQLLLMAILLVVLLIPLVRQQLHPTAMRTFGGLRLCRSLTEERVIAEFLRSEFHHVEFEEYRHEFGHLVTQPDFESHSENTLRRALLFLRRGSMWRELTGNTKWFEVALNGEDLARVRFFPRAQWRRVAQGSFYLGDVVECIRQKLKEPSHDDFVGNLRLLSESFHDSQVSPTVLLIGIDDKGPLTILDGNHRMAAAMLSESPVMLSRLQFICGFSADMIDCCWYHTSVAALARYFTNLVRSVFHDPTSAIARFRASNV